ncbi:hypothetical protein OW763_13015 [Clostridium aestuarii]|uniref:Prepilin-type N-terminal cleavage/methylation domain-containing protein n=1 Tax=Clostridium aestuarii TaxID=338193 RepID=A0ABT4D1Z3_9CLOT|nr:hypothetical protein [Clostridium aestuarii]MCY6485261.1 hypothetical protein [Clostridium aestuarii]
MLIKDINIGRKNLSYDMQSLKNKLNLFEALTILFLLITVLV